jgi:glycosyltransferase involved in cell wall biosynthesis
MDVLIFRIDFSAPASTKLGLPPYRQIINSPVIVWEMNGVPEFGRVLGLSEDEIREFTDSLRYYGRGCDLAVCVSDKMAEYVKEKIRIKRIITVPNGSDPNLFRPDAEPIVPRPDPSRVLNVIWMGSGALKWNNFELLRDSAILLKDTTQPAIKFHILGQSPGDIIESMPSNVAYHGLIEYEQLPGWLAAMHIGLCIYQPGPADFGSPLKLFDYMASGLTVISTPQPQVKEIFAELNQTDLIFPPESPVDLAECLLKLSRNRNRINTQGRLGRELIINQYNWRRNVQRIMQAVEELI